MDSPTDERLPAKVETALFRVTQEGLTNIVKHAEATAIHLILVRRERSVVLTIDDNGRGFPQGQVSRGRLGLVGMRERIASINGSLEIESKRGAGTRLRIEIPLP
jgi:signal transduction histidine kinase